MGQLGQATIRPIDDVESAYYLNVEVLDRPGVLARVAGVFGDHGVSIRSMEQEGLGDEARLIFITHRAREADVQATLRDLRRARGRRPHRLGHPRRRRRRVSRCGTCPLGAPRPPSSFGDVLLAGLADDGGLYVPEAWPQLGPGFDGKRPYAEVATDVMWPYVEGSIGRDDFARLVAESYATFDHPDVCPLVEVDDLHVLELFWGPTLAFKDVALQLVGRLFDHELAKRDGRATIVVATSGDTGSAAIEACIGRDTLDIVVLHPADRVSDVQRRQMTTVDAPNVHNVAVEGTFDDCQDLVKACFADVAFRERVRLSAMNSINWARVMAQVVYYVTTRGPARSLLVRGAERQLRQHLLRAGSPSGWARPSTSS